MLTGEPASSPSRAPPDSDGRCSVIACESTYSLSFLSIFQYLRPSTTTSSYCRTLTEPTSGLSSIMRGGGGGAVGSGARFSEDFGSRRALATLRGGFFFSGFSRVYVTELGAVTLP